MTVYAYEEADACTCDFCRRSDVLDNDASWDLFANDDLQRLAHSALVELARREARR